MSVLLLLLALCMAVGPAWSGTPCPERSSIYPCSCQSNPLPRRATFTEVTCHRLPDTASLTALFPVLREMLIDSLLVYDSFWVEEQKKEKQVFPPDWLSLLRVEKIEIVDTPLSSCFACEASRLCSNSITTSFKASNISSHEKICSICKTRSGSKFSWVGCMSRLQEFQFRYTKLTAVREDLFPVPMRQLTKVDLSHNQISEVDAEAFSQTSKLKVLVLSYNHINKLDKMFGKMNLPDLEILDLSSNLLKTLGTPSFFPKLLKLKKLLLSQNLIMNLREIEWTGVRNENLLVDLNGNPIHCDCSIRWINSTYPAKNLKGTCKTPNRYKNSYIRQISFSLANLLPKNVTCEDWIKSKKVMFSNKEIVTPKI